MSLQTRQHSKIGTEPWPPEWARLPSLQTLEAISRGEGRKVQARLFDEQRDQSKEARLRRLLADVPGVRTADTMAGGKGR